MARVEVNCPAFWPSYASAESMAARALEFAILTAARTGEVIGARWAEINLEARLWTIAGERMKAGREHRVPPSRAALAILRAVAGGKGEHVFPGSRANQPLSQMAMLMLLRSRTPAAA